MMKFPVAMRMKTVLVTMAALICINQYAQDWKTYPYFPAGSLISFPSDEGRHAGESVEWWYTSGHLTGLNSGNNYNYMLTYFYYTDTPVDGMRILILCNETTGEYYSNTSFISYPVLSTDHMELQALLPTASTEYWKTIKDTADNLIPFEYELKSAASFGKIELNYITTKKPLILADSGLLLQGAGGYTYYYSQTGIDVLGQITFGGTQEEVSGSAWIDRQYGQTDPLKGEEYEWFCIQLSDGADLNIWNIFNEDNEIPPNSRYRIASGYINDTVSFTSSAFEIERLGFHFTEDSQRCYAGKWRITADTFGIDLVLDVILPDTEIQNPLRFFEGSIEAYGSFNGGEVTGTGFAELLHSYEKPDIEFISFPDTIDSGESFDLTWNVSNPDEGNKLQYCLRISDEQTYTIYDTCLTGITGLAIVPDEYFTGGDMNVKLTAFSADFTLATKITNNFFFKKEGLSYPEIAQGGSEKYPLHINRTGRNKIHISKVESNGILRITSESGIMVKYLKLTRGEEATVDTADIVPGIYFITYQTTGNLYNIQKIYLY
jgi:predicted secreted hydrolase